MLDRVASTEGMPTRTRPRLGRPTVIVVALSEATAWAGQQASPEQHAAVFPCATLASNAGVRFDGLYQDSPPEVTAGVAYWHYLRLYADGTVLVVTSSGTPAQVAGWLTKKKSDLGKGCATLRSGKIQFADTSSEGTVEYHGTVESGGLALHSVSRINGSESDHRFRFVPVQFADDTGAAPGSSANRLDQTSPTPATAPGQPSPAQPSAREQDRGRYLLLRLVEDTYVVGKDASPLFVATYTADGKQPPCRGMMCTSGDFSDVTIDMSELTQDKTPTLGGQEREGRTEAIVSLRRRNCTKVYIDKNGVVFPDGSTQVASGGPYVPLAFQSPENKTIDLGSLVVSVSSRSRSRYPTKVHHGILLVEKVGVEPLNIHLQQKAGHQKEVLKLFPKLRGATDNVIIYLVRARVGTPMSVQPSSYDDFE